MDSLKEIGVTFLSSSNDDIVFGSVSICSNNNGNMSIPADIIILNVPAGVNTSNNGISVRERGIYTMMFKIPGESLLGEFGATDERLEIRVTNNNILIYEKVTGRICLTETIYGGLHLFINKEDIINIHLFSKHGIDGGRNLNFLLVDKID